MGGTSSFGGIFIQLENSSCFNGQEVLGVIHVDARVNLAPSTLYLSFTGHEHSEWQDRRSGDPEESSETYKNQGNYQICNFQCQLYNFQFGVTVGNYSLPFTFVLPQNIPSSFFYALGTTRASITYRFQADLISTRNERLSGGANVHIRQAVLGINTDLSVSKNPQMKTWCCIDKGSCEIHVSYPQDTYHPSQIAEFKVVVNNSQSKIRVNSLACSFGYSIRLRDSGTGIKFIKDTLLRSQVNVNIEPRAELLNDTSVEFKLNLPSKIKLLENMYSTKGKLIECIYTNNIEAIMDGSCMCCGERPSVSSIMTIVPNIVIPPSAPQAPEDWQPRVLERVSVSYDSSNGNQAR